MENRRWTVLTYGVTASALTQLHQKMYMVPALAN